MNLKSDPEARKVFNEMFFRSSAYAVSAYFTITILEKIYMAAIGALFGYEVKFTYERLKIFAERADWSQETVLVIYMFPQILMIIAYIWLYLRSMKENDNPSYNLLFTEWIMFFISFRVLAMTPVHLFCHTGIYHALSWLYVESQISIVLGLFALVLFFLTGIKRLNSIFFLFGTYNNHFEVIGIKNLVLASVLYPSVICTAIAAAFYTPGFPKEEMIGLMLFVLIVLFTFIRFLIIKPVLLTSRFRLEENFKRNYLIIVLVAAISLVRILLGIGISFN